MSGDRDDIEGISSDLCFSCLRCLALSGDLSCDLDLRVRMGERSGDLSFVYLGLCSRSGDFSGDMFSVEPPEERITRNQRVHLT